MSGYDGGLVCCFRAFVEHEKISINPKVRSMERNAVRISIFEFFVFSFGNWSYCF